MFKNIIRILSRIIVAVCVLIWAFLSIAFIVIKALITMIVLIVFNPIWYPFFRIYQKRRRENFIELMSLLSTNDIKIFDQQLHDQNSKIYQDLADTFTFDYEEFLLLRFEEITTQDHTRLLARIDWAEIADEVEAQLNALIKARGIQEYFQPTTLNEYVDSIPIALCEFEHWVSQRGYRLILWDQGSDEYLIFICKHSDSERLLELAKKTKLKFAVDAIYHGDINLSKEQVIKHLEFLINAAKERDVEQGIITFGHFVEELKKEGMTSVQVNTLYKDLYSQICSMMRFAYFPDNEYSEVMLLLSLLNLHKVLNSPQP